MGTKRDLRLAAAGPEDVVKATELFNKADAFRAVGKYEDACPLLEESQKLDPQVGTQLYLADCYEQTGRLRLAYDAFRDYRLGAVTLSAQMMGIVKRMLAGEAVTQEGSGLSKREWRELMETLGRDAA